jgi:hypothetical protein
MKKTQASDGAEELTKKTKEKGVKEKGVNQIS